MLRTIYEGDRRHIVGIHVPGDFVDLHAYALKRLDHNIVALGPVAVELVEGLRGRVPLGLASNSPRRLVDGGGARHVQRTPRRPTGSPRACEPRQIAEPGG